VWGTKVAGRGAKPFAVQPTEKLQKEILTPLLQQLEKQTSSDLRPLLRKSMRDILADLKAKNTRTRGLALEALAFKLMRLLDMDYVATRLRASATGGAEVDLIFQSARLVFSRWQVQCKNTSRVNLEDVAKEVGLTHLLKSNVVVVVSTGEVGASARGYANKIMSDTNLCLVLVNGDDLFAIEKNPATIVDVFKREAVHAMQLKLLEL
jgi:site-specific DNA-methyltransferase (cytosine-N4-specific)